MRIIKIISVLSCILSQSVHAQTDQGNLKRCIDNYQQSKYDAAYKTCLPLAQSNNPMAQFVVGNLLDHGLGVATDTQLALDWFKKAADGGNASAQLKLAKMYYKGTKQTPIDHTLATQYLQHAANHHVCEAQFMLSLCYLKGIGVSQNVHSARHWYNQAVLSGLTNGKLLENPIETRVLQASENAEEAYKIATQLSQDEEGLHLESDLIWRSLAAEKDHPQAQYDLCLHYLKNARSDSDLHIALNWLHKAATNEHQGAQLHLAWISALGIDTPENMNLAVQWFNRACDQSNTTTIAKSNNNDDYKVKQAIELLESSVDDQDIDHALSTLDRGAKEGSAQAQFYLGRLYQTGRFVHQDKTLAAHLFEKASQNGHLEAQFNLGWMYLQGDGIPREYIQAYYWLNKAGMIHDKPLKQSEFKNRISHLAGSL